MTSPTVKQFGLVQGSGSLASIVDGDDGTGWAPSPDGLEAYSAPFLASGLPNSAASFPGFEFDFGAPVRMAAFMFTTETPGTLARGMLISSNNPATGVGNMVQAGDVLLGIYEQEEVNSGRAFPTRARDLDIRGRYVRFVMRDQTVEDTSDVDYVDPSTGSRFDDAGPFSFIVPEYSGEWVTEGWGGGASGGLSGEATAGGATTVMMNDSDPLLTANGGGKSALTVPNSAASAAAGGTAANASPTNTTGGAGGTPSPTNTSFGTTGKGGDAPNGGTGGASVNAVFPAGLAPGGVTQPGNPGASPGGGGSGRAQYVPDPSGLITNKYPGGASGGYFRDVRVRGVDGPEPGQVIIGTIGAGGPGGAGNGAGANGRVKFSFSE